jgi:hypothetical protein
MLITDEKIRADNLVRRSSNQLNKRKVKEKESQAGRNVARGERGSSTHLIGILMKRRENWETDLTIQFFQWCGSISTGNFFSQICLAEVNKNYETSHEPKKY